MINHGYNESCTQYYGTCSSCEYIRQPTCAYEYGEVIGNIYDNYR